MDALPTVAEDVPSVVPSDTVELSPNSIMSLSSYCSTTDPFTPSEIAEMEANHGPDWRDLLP